MIKRKHLIKVVALSIALTVTSWFVPKGANKIVTNQEPIATPTTEDLIDINHVPIVEKKEITLSFVGDCTLGTDTNFGYSKSFTEVFDKNNHDYNYFFDGVDEILESDDLTIANLETTFTDATQKRDKHQKLQFHFKGDPAYVNILLEGSVEAVNIANNHMNDYGKKGYNDTINTLNNANIGYFGDNFFMIKEIKGIKFGFAGFTALENINQVYIQIDEAMKYFEENNIDIKIVSFHWGIERHNIFSPIQEKLGKYAIDKGADLVIGHHPHVLQGIEEYNGSYIVYSLGNFVFGGNKNPPDYDSMIFQQTFSFKNNELVDKSINIIPVSLSSKKEINDYQPTIGDDQNKDLILSRIKKYSPKK